MPRYDYICPKCGYEQELYVSHPDQRAEQECQLTDGWGRICDSPLGSPRILSAPDFVCTGPGTHAMECQSPEEQQKRAQGAIDEAPKGPNGAIDMTRVGEVATGVKRPRRIQGRDTSKDGYGTGDK